MKNRIRLTESELNSMILESIRKILREGYNDNPLYTHYAILKNENKIVDGWEYRGISSSELRQFKDEYFFNDLRGNGINPKEVKIWTRGYCVQNGVDPSDDNNWTNYPAVNNQPLTESRETPYEEDVYFTLGEVLNENPNWKEWYDAHEENFPQEDIDATVWYTYTPEDGGTEYAPSAGDDIYVQDVEIKENELTDYLQSVLSEEEYNEVMHLMKTFVVHTTENGTWGRYM